MDITEFFDPDNIEHIKALGHLNRTGVWPEGFLPENVKQPELWLFQIYNKLASRWVRHMLNKEKSGD